MEASNSFLLVYGSETGQAQSIAEQIAEKSAELDLHARLHCLEQTGKQFDIEKETCMVMVTSTTGDGDAPDNASKFLRRIKKKVLSSDYLSQLNYALLGLGDTNYNNFCKCAKDMDSRLEQLGAQRFYPTGLADDGAGLEIVCDPWLDGLYPALKKHLESSNITQAVEGHLSQIVDDISLADKQPSMQLVSNGDLVNPSALNESRTGIDLANDKDVSHNPVSSSRLVNDSNSNNSSHVSPDNAIDNSLEGNSSETCIPIPVVGTDSVESSGVKKSDASGGSNSMTDAVISNTILDASCNGVSSNGVGGLVDVDSKSDSVSKQGDASIRVKTILLDDIVENDTSNSKSVIRDSCPSLSGRNLTVPVLAPEFLQAEYCSQRVETEAFSFQNGCKLPSAVSDIVLATVAGARVLTHPDALKKTLWLSLSIKEPDMMEYSAGDSISVICQNSGDEVQLLLERLKASELADQQMNLTLIPDTKKRRAAVPPHIHPVTTLRHVLTACVSIRDVPSKALLRTLVEYTADETEKRRLQELCSKEGAEEYTRCIRGKNVSLLDVLYAFPSCQPPVLRVLEFLTRLLPRPYSVCSCPETNPGSLDIVFNVIDIRCDMHDGGGHYYSRRGVCTGWLDDITSSLQSGSTDGISPVQIPMFFRSNQHFRPPTDLSKPLILVGPGTGVAPFIGFLQQRALLKSNAGNDENYGETWIFTGCRHKAKDYLFRESLEEFEESGVVSRLCVSFSRDTDSPHRYVQDYLRSDGASIANLLVEKEALIYVCGDAKNMSKDVSCAFQEILSKEKAFSVDEANAFMMKKRLHRTYFEDVWT